MPEAFMTWIPENNLENEFQFQLQGYAGSAEGVNPLGHKRA
ncbi:MAG: hypothetical protein WCA20_29440 [Candidatus Sulfotelmatobacter sp.]